MTSTQYTWTAKNGVEVVSCVPRDRTGILTLIPYLRYYWFRK